MTVKLMCVSLALWLIVGCTPAPSGLADTHWVLTSSGKPGAESAVTGLPFLPFTLRFGPSDEASGSTGCNTYWGKYQTHGNVITFHEIWVTQVACRRPGVVTLEGLYLAALDSTGTYTLSADTLTVSYNDGQEVLHFIRIAQSK
jgi:heat shock protein HslJ